MPRICGVCNRSPREGEEMRPIRLRTEEDLEETTVGELGLYHACEECVDAHRKRVMARPDCEFASSDGGIPNGALM